MRIENSAEDWILNGLARQEKPLEATRRANNPQFFTIKKEWDKLRPGQTDAEGNILTEVNFSYFADVYKEEELDKDEATLMAIKAKRASKRRGPTGEVGEYIIEEGLYNHQWLTEDVEVLPTHEYDDTVNNVDFVLRFYNNKNEPFYLGVDVTTMEDESIVAAGRKKMLAFLEAGQLQEIKYFEDAIEGIKGKLQLPKVIVVLSKRDAFLMQDILLNIKSLARMSPSDRKKYQEDHKWEIKAEEDELKRVQADVETEFINQIKAIAIFLQDEIRTLLKAGSSDATKIKNLQQGYFAYKNILEVIEKRA